MCDKVKVETIFTLKELSDSAQMKKKLQEYVSALKESLKL